MTIRALLPEDASAARALIQRQFGGTRYEARLAELLGEVLTGGEEGVVAVERGDVVALVLFGTVAGARETTRVHVVLGADPALAAKVVDHVANGMRLVVAEVPDDAPFAAMHAALQRAAFSEEGTVAGWIASDVALRLLARRAQ